MSDMFRDNHVTVKVRSKNAQGYPNECEGHSFCIKKAFTSC